MAYATTAEFVAAVTDLEAAQLAKAAAPATGYDAARIALALADASAELDTYFSAKYATPLTPPPATAKQATICLAREALDRQGRDFVKAAAARWRAWAKDVARGTAVLGGGVIGTDVPAANTSTGVSYSAPDRVFDDTGLAGFLGGGS